MPKPPSLADRMKSVAAPAPLRPAPERAGEPKLYFAATREGMKRITVEAAHRRNRAIDRGFNARSLGGFVRKT
jgi:hypothetical protein